MDGGAARADNWVHALGSAFARRTGGEAPGAGRGAEGKKSFDVPPVRAQSPGLLARLAPVRLSSPMNAKERELLDAIGLKPCPVLLRRPVTIALDRAFYLPGLIAGLLAFAVSYRHGIAAAALAGALAAVALVASLAAHESGHLLFGRHVKGISPRILLLRSTGGVSIVEGRFEDARGAAVFASGGPLVTLATTVVYAVAGLALPAGPFRMALLLPAGMNVLLLLINLLPVAPMDGYMLFRSALWASIGNRAEAEKRALGWSQSVLAWGAVLSLLLLARSREAGALSLLLLATFVVQHHLVFRKLTSARQRRGPTGPHAGHA